MGVCGSKEQSAPGVTPEDAQRSKTIDRQLRDDEARMAKEVKILLLGAGESGKTTVLKQMKIIHKDGFTPDEREIYRQQVFANLCEGMRCIVEALYDWEIELENRANWELLPIFDDAPTIEPGQAYPGEYKRALLALWADQGIQRVYARANEAALPENLVYFYPQLDRLFSPDFIPTNDDIVRTRGKTNGIVETNFASKPLTYRLFDVGGQRSERKKWIHCFENVMAVIFLAALSGYDQCLIEDKDSNTMQEALMLFNSIVNSVWFKRTSIILFLNKLDIFETKLAVSSVVNHFPDYAGPPNDLQAAKAYFKARFTRLNKSSQKEIYTHYTTAVDTKLLKVVMASVTDILITRNLAAEIQL